MTVSTGRTTRVIGWYHSHPHITVLPSHVDVRTQAMYQLLDSGFIGLIFSCFSEDINKVGRIQIIAFQSSDGKQHQMSLSPVSRNSIIDLESPLSSSENVAIRSGSGKEGGTPEQDSGDSRTAGDIKVGGRSSDLGVFFSNADATYIGREKYGGNYNADNANRSIIDIDPMDMSESMQEAMHRSNLDLSGAEHVRKEVPLHVLPTSSLVKLESPLKSYTDLQHVLYEEERAAYNNAISQNMRDGKVHPLTFVHHTSTYQASMCKLIEYCLSPAINALQDRLRENELRLAMLNDEAKRLEIEATKVSEPSLSPRIHSASSGSPRQASSPGYRGSAALSHRDLHGSAESRGAKLTSSPVSQSRKATQ